MGAPAIMPRLTLLSCLSSRDQETGMYLSHCLNFDIMECGKTAEEAWQNLKISVKSYVEHCYTNYQEGLIEAAPQEKWDEFAAAATRRAPRMEQIEIELRPPLPEHESPVWMQGVVLADGPQCNHVH